MREEARAAEKPVLHLTGAVPESKHKTPHIEPHPYSQTRQDPKEPQTVTVNPGDPIDKLVNRAPAGTTFIFVPGLHRIQRIQPKDGQSFIGMKGAIISGAVELHGFTGEGSRWVLDDQPKHGAFHGVCAKNPDRSESRACQYSQDLFMDGVALLPVEGLGELKPGRWYYDQDNERIYIADSPGTHAIELSVTTAAFMGSAKSVTVRGLTIEKFANPAQSGAIHNYSTPSQSGRGWVVEENNIMFNHGIGLRVDEGALVRHNHVHHNGQLGIAASGQGVVIEKNELAYNNTLGFSYWWEAGGSKFVRTQDLIVRQNHVHHNIGPGLWTDGYNVNALYEDNLVEDNHGPGISHEISYNAVIAGNMVRRNGFSIGWYTGAGILIHASSDVEVRDNHVLDNANGIIALQQDRGNGPQGLHQVKNVYVHDNHVGMAVGASGLAFDPKYTGVQTANGTRFESNSYEISGQRQSFVWLGKALTKNQWIDQGHDTNGKFLPHQ
jgi:hypothetical protein